MNKRDAFKRGSIDNKESSVAKRAARGPATSPSASAPTAEETEVLQAKHPSQPTRRVEAHRCSMSDD